MPVKKTRKIFEQPVVAETASPAPAMQAALPAPQERKLLNKPAIGATAIAVLAIAAAGFVYMQSLKANNRVAQLQRQLAEVQAARQNPQVLGDATNANTEASQLLAEVGKLMVLPENEQPTIATVTDLEKLKDQPFFAKAQVGDKVLIYTSAKKAILYRPTENKIIELAPLSVSQPAAQTKKQPSGTSAKATP